MVLGAGGALALALGGGAAALAHPVWQSGKFLNAGAAVLGGVGRAVLAGALPAESTAQAAALSRLVQGVEAVLQNFPQRTQKEFIDLVALLAHPWGRTAMGLGSDWPDASTVQISDWLQGLRASRLGLRQQAYHGLHDITLAAHFGDPAVWPSIGYELPIRL
jgi:hypothetical protein